MDIYIADHKLTSGYPIISIVNNGSALYTLTLTISESLSSTFMAHLTRGSSVAISTVDNSVTTIWTGTVDECSIAAGFTIVKVVDVILTAPPGILAETHIISRYPVLSTAAFETADSEFEEVIFEVPTGMSFTINDVGFIPTAAIGQATDYAVLGVYNRGTDGTGTTLIAELICSTALVIDAKNSFGTISYEDIGSGDVITVKKTVEGNGQIIPVGSWYIELVQ